MKELEKTKRISIAAVLFILVILIGVLSFKRPKNLYAESAKATLEQITTNNYLVALDNVQNDENTVIIDIRNQYEFEKGHLPNATNINTNDILTDNAINTLDEYKDSGKKVAIYGDTPNEALTAFMLLDQLGYKNLEIIAIKNSYDHNKLITENVAIEKSNADIQGFIDESIKKAKAAAIEPPKIVKPVVQKKVIPVVKKKKAPVEGGC